MASPLEELRALSTQSNLVSINSLNPGPDLDRSKYAKLKQASEESLLALRQAREEKLKNADSWSAILGVQDTPVVGTAVDLAASYVSGASRLIGNVVNLPNNALNAFDEQALSDADKAAIFRYKNNQATAEDKLRIFKKDAFGDSPVAIAKRIEERNTQSKDRADYWDTSSIVNQRDRSGLNEDLSSAYADAKTSFDKGDTVTGVAKLLYGGGKAILTNPKATSEYIAENIPQLLGGALGTAGKVVIGATNIGYAADEYRKGVQAYMDANNGALPPDDVRQRMALESAALALAEHAADAGQLKAIGNIGKTGKAVEGAAQDAAKEGFLKAVAKATGTGALEEGLTESYQTLLENSISGTTATGEDIYKAGVIGAASGAGLSGGGKALVKASEIAGDTVKRAEEDLATQEAVKNAIDTGDYSAIVNPDSPTYAPHKVADVILAKASNQEFSSDEKKNAFSELNGIISDFEAAKKEVAASTNELASEDKQLLQDRIDVAQAKLDQLDSDKAEKLQEYSAIPGVDLEKVNAVLDNRYKAEQDTLSKEIESNKATLNAPVRTAQEAALEIKKLDEKIAYVKERKNDLSTLFSQVKPADVSSLVQKVTTVDPKTVSTDTTVQQEVKDAGDKLVSFAMVNTDNVSIEQAKTLSESTNLTEEQRNYFAAYTKSKEAEIAAKDMKAVSKEVFKGDVGFVGIDNYRKDFADAMSNNDQKEMDRLFTQLKRFTMGHISKGKAMEAAYAKAKSTGEAVFIVRNDDSKTGGRDWTVSSKPLSKEEFTTLKEEGKALQISPRSLGGKFNSDNLASAVIAESNALTALTKEFHQVRASYLKSKATETTQTTTTPQTMPEANTASIASVSGLDAVSSVPTTENVSTAPETSPISSFVAPEVANETNVVTQSVQPTQTQEISNVPQTIETKQTETQGQEQQQVTEPAGRLELGSQPTITQDQWIAAADHLMAVRSNPSNGTVENSLGIGVEPVIGEIAKAMNSGVSFKIEDAPQQQQAIVDSNAPEASTFTAGESTSISASAPSNSSTEEHQGAITSLVSKVADISNKTIQQLYDEAKTLPAFITQKGKNLPLLKVKDFFTNWGKNEGEEGKVSLLDFADKDPELKEIFDNADNEAYANKINAIDNLPDRIASIGKILKKTLVPVKGMDTLKSTKDPFQQLFNDDGSIDENVITAMSLAGVLYVMNHSNDLPDRDLDTGTYKDTFKMIGLEEYSLEKFLDQNDDQTLEQIRSSITVTSSAQAELGKIATDLLGMRNRNKHVPENYLPQLQTSMGIRILNALMSNKLNLIHEVEYVLGKNDGQDIIGKVIRFNMDEKGNYSKEVNSYAADGRAIQYLVENLFGVESSALMPSSKPIKFAQEKTQKAGNEIPSLMKKVAAEDNASPFYVDKNMMDIAEAVGIDTLIRIAGGVDFADTAVQANRGASVEAKNHGLQLETDLMFQSLETLTPDGQSVYETPVYLSTAVQGIQRFHILTRGVNPMASKIHRNIFVKKEWETTINADDKELLLLLKVAIATGLGKNPDTNKQTSLEEQLDEMLKEPKISKVVDAIKKVLYPQNQTDRNALGSKDIQDTLVEVAAGEENMMTLRALVSLAQLQHAEETGFAEPLVTTQLFGIDGKVNGTALVHTSWGTDNIWKIGPQTGFYSGDANVVPKNYVDYSSRGFLDAYQNTFKEVAKLLEDYPESFLHNRAYQFNETGAMETYKGLVNAVENITGLLYDSVKGSVEKAGRNMVKTPITALHFGSVIESVKAAATRDFLDSVYKRIEKAFTKLGDTEKPGYNRNADVREAAKIIESLNTLMAFKQFKYEPYKEARIPAKVVTLRDLLNYEFSPLELKKIQGGFHASVAQHIGTAFENSFADYLEKREVVTNTTAIMFAMYNAMKEAYTQEIIKEGIEKGTIANFVGKKLNKVYAYHDLSTAQKQELDRRLGQAVPMIHTVLSKRDDNVRAGIKAAKSDVGIVDSNEYQVSAEIIDSNTGEKVRVNTYAEGKRNAPPSVGPLSSTIHSLESAIMQTTRSEIKAALNINDEIAVGVNKAKETAILMNKNTAEMVLEYSPLVAILETASKTVESFAAFKKTNAEAQKADLMDLLKKHMSEQTLKAFKKDSTLSMESFVEQTLNQMISAVEGSEITRSAFFSNLQYVDQYPMEGGQYVVPQEYRDTAKAKADLKHIEPLSTKIKESLFTLASGSEINSENQVEDIKVQNASDISTVKKAIDYITSGDKLSKGSKYLAKLIYKNVPARTPIKLVTREELFKIDPSLSKDSVGAYIYNTTKDKGTVYVVADNANNVKAEVLLHEFAHAALHKVIAEGQRIIDLVAKNRATHTEASKLVAELDQIRLAAMRKADQLGILNFKAHTQNVQEFVAYATSDVAFQEFLAGIQYKSNTSENSFVNAMKGIFEVLKRLLFPGTTDTALDAAMANILGLSKAAESFKEAGKENATLSMIAQAKAQVDSYNTLDIYEALATKKPGFSKEFDTHLRTTLSTLVSAIRGPFGSLRSVDMVNTTATPLDIWTKSIATGQAPLVSKLSQGNVRMTAQERFVAQQIEAVMVDAQTNPDVRVSAAMQEMKRLFASAKAALQPKDFYKGNWNKATQQNKAKAQAMYDFLFNVKSENGVSDYIGNFVALGLGNETVNKALNISAGKVQNKSLIGATLTETIGNVFNYLLNLYTGLATKTSKEMQMNEKLAVLTNTLISIEAKKRNVLKRNLESKVDPVLDALGVKFVSAIKKSVAKFLGNPIFTRNKYSGVRLAASATKIILEDRMPQVLNAITQMRNEFNKEKHGLAMNLFNDVKGYGRRISAFVRMATAINAEREHIASQLSRVVISGFENQGKDLTDEDHRAITGGLLRTGAHVLLGRYTMAGIAQLLNNPSKLDNAIDVIEKEMDKRYGNKANYFIHQSKGLAALMVTGKSLNQAGQLTNALMISREANGNPNKLSENDQKDAELMIDEISTLYALKYREIQEPGSNAYLAKLIEKENAKGEGVNGILEAMTLQQKLNEDVKNTLFSGSEVLMRKGYLPEITNPHTSFEVAGTDAKTKKEYEERGYEVAKELFQDPNDPNSNGKAIYVLRDGAPSAYVSGAIQLDSNKSKGSKVVGTNRNLNTMEGVMNSSEMAQIKQSKLPLVAQTYSSNSRNWNPMVAKDANFMVPLFDQNMKIVNWRYEMSHDARDSILERDNRVQEVLSTMAATTFGKETAAQQNRAVVEALKQDYDRNFNLNRNHFIYISPLSDDKDIRDIWHMMPYQMKQDVKEIMKDGKGMWIRKEYVLPVFGYRKYSLSEIWTKEEKLNIAEEAFKTTVEWLLKQYAQAYLGKSLKDSENYAKRAYIYVRRGQRAWEEIVAQVKDIVVIRTGTVMLGNIISNFSLLKANGVPIGEMIKNHHVAIKAYNQYDEASKELFELETEKSTGFLRGNAAAKESRINELKDTINRSPIKKLIDAGLRPSIVEDLTDIDDQYSYKSAFVHKMDKYVDQINPTVREVANEVLITKKSKLYGALSKTTQMSDFVARYVLFEHLTKRQNNPLSEKDAVFEVSEAFINYDIPMAKGMQFLDDMGFTPFVKYFFRIQRVLFKTAKEHPAQMLALVALDHFYSSLPLVTDSSFISHIGNNPFRSGAGQIFTVLDDTLVLDSLSKLVK